MDVDEAKAYENGILDPAPARAKRGAFGLILLSSTMFFVPLFAARFLWAYASKPDGINYVLWSILTLIMILSLFPTSSALKSAYQGDNGGIARNLSLALFMMLIVEIGIIYHFFNGQIPVGTKYGENLNTDAFALMFTMLLPAIAFMAHVSAGAKQKIKESQAWKVHNAVSYWRHLVGMWVIFYIIYFLV